MASSSSNNNKPPLTGFSLHVGNLHPTVTEEHLKRVFSSINRNVSVYVNRDYVTKVSLCFGWVSYSKADDAAKALVDLKDTKLAGRKINLSRFRSDPYYRVYEEGNLFVKNLHSTVDATTLRDVFQTYGDIESVLIVEDENGNSRGYGYVQFRSSADAKTALELNGRELAGKRMIVNDYLGDKRSRDASRLHVRHRLNGDISEAMLRGDFSRFGVITEVMVKTDADGRSKYGFVTYDNYESALKALRGKDDSKWYVGWAKKKPSNDSGASSSSSHQNNFMPQASTHQNLHHDSPIFYHQASSSSCQNTFIPQAFTHHNLHHDTNPLIMYHQASSSSTFMPQAATHQNLHHDTTSLVYYPQVQTIPSYIPNYHVMVSNLPDSVTEGELFDMFGTLDRVHSANLIGPGYGHVYFYSLEAAERTVKHFNGMEYDKGFCFKKMAQDKTRIHVSLCTTSDGTLCDVQH